MEYWQLKQKQSLPLAQKVRLSEVRIRQWYDHWHSQVYVAFSGGKDSTVLLHLVRSLYPNVPAVFCDTGLEYPEIRDFVKTIDNVTWIKPMETFKQVIKKHGYPVLSKQISMGVSRYIHTQSSVQKHLRLYGGTNPTSGKKQTPTIPAKWHHLIEAPFKISEVCCDILKKRPAKKYERKSGRKPYVGTMACDSFIRRNMYLNKGCNLYSQTKARSTPLGIWFTDDVWDYIRMNNLPYSKVYDMGEDNTGCMFCMFGVHLDGEPNRFQRMKTNHSKQYDYCISKLGCGKVLDYIGVSY